MMQKLDKKTPPYVFEYISQIAYDKILVILYHFSVERKNSRVQ